MSLTENSCQLFLPWDATELKILNLAPRPYSVRPPSARQRKAIHMAFR